MQSNESYRGGRLLAALCVSTAALGLFAEPVAAQNRPSANPAEVDENQNVNPPVAPTVEPAADAATSEVDDIIVTGSRIRGVAPVGSNLIAVGRTDLVQSGATTTADVLRQVPQITSLGFNSEGSLGAAAASNITRASAPNLRGIGPTATLTILDGHRVSTAGTQGQLVDPSFLPTLALERVEVIADGASAIYGSDAVAGVINLIPRKNFKGAEVSTRLGDASNYWDYQVAGIVGTNWGSGHVMVAADHTWNSALSAANRSYYTSDHRSFGGSSGQVTTCSPGTANIGGTSYALPNGNGRNVQLSQLTPNTSNFCDAARLDTIIPETTRTSVYGYAEQELGGLVKLFAQGFYSKRNFSSTRSQPFLNNVAVPVTNPFMPLGVTPGTPVSVSYSLVSDVGSGTSRGYTEVYQGLAGAEIEVSGFRIRASGSIGQGSDNETQRVVNNYYLNAALADPNPATAFNPFGGPGANNPLTLANIFNGVSIIGGVSKLKTAELNIDGSLFTLPGGAVRIAAGGEYRKESLTSVVTANLNPFSPTAITQSHSVSRDVKAVYGELFVPIFGADNATTGIQSLDLSLALRWEDYSDFGTTTNPKVGVNWSPVGGLTFRGSYGTSFRAPSLSESDANSSGAGIYQFPIPVPGRGLTNLVVLAGGNPNLSPEKATTWSVGFDLSPALVSGLRINGTYFNIAYKNQIVDGFGLVTNYLVEPQNYPNYIAYAGSPNFAAFQQIVRNSGQTTPVPIDYSRVDAIVDARRQNIGTVNTDGLDLQVNYTRDTTSAGTFSVGANGTYFLNYETGNAGLPLVDRNNTISYPARFTARGTLGWALGGFSTQATANYTNGYKNTNSVLVPNVSSYTTIDLDVSYQFGDDAGNFARGFRIGLNARNLFDRNPPMVDIGNGYDPSKASALGRIVALTVSKKW